MGFDKPVDVFSFIGRTDLPRHGLLFIELNVPRLIKNHCPEEDHLPKAKSVGMTMFTQNFLNSESLTQNFIMHMSFYGHFISQYFTHVGSLQNLGYSLVLDHTNQDALIDKHHNTALSPSVLGDVPGWPSIFELGFPLNQNPKVYIFFRDCPLKN